MAFRETSEQMQGLRQGASPGRLTYQVYPDQRIQMQASDPWFEVVLHVTTGAEQPTKEAASRDVFLLLRSLAKLLVVSASVTSGPKMRVSDPYFTVHMGSARRSRRLGSPTPSAWYATTRKKLGKAAIQSH